LFYLKYTNAGIDYYMSGRPVNPNAVYALSFPSPGFAVQFALSGTSLLIFTSLGSGNIAGQGTTATDFSFYGSNPSLPISPNTQATCHITSGIVTCAVGASNVFEICGSTLQLSSQVDDGCYGVTLQAVELQ
jgi:hypothetical protein